MPRDLPYQIDIVLARAYLGDGLGWEEIQKVILLACRQEPQQLFL